MKLNLFLLACLLTFSTGLFAQHDHEKMKLEMEIDSVMNDTSITKSCCAKKMMDGHCKSSNCSKCTSKCSDSKMSCCKNINENKCSTSGSCCGTKYKNIISFGGKYFFSPLGNTRTLLADNGFILDEEALEFQVRLYNLPKVFYYQQLGTLDKGRYSSVIGIGVKEDLRWNIIKNSPFFFTPYIELGAGYYRMNLVKGINGNSITSVLNSSVETNYAENFVITGDIGVDLGVGFKLDRTRLSILVNGGYLTNVPSEWRLAGSLAFKEKINMSSPYVGATIRLEAAR
ncbi:MAG TPA: hypothetical protein PK047_08160 [Saprospiraceae bacterium]|jgi:hypothetical protein|nr:hypothetical protein [Saprospiraceae bacterium]HRO08828.1 hypothetical protein [Saprospiraceae bacterium]HRP42083.1 hypothetical protein [Saprospiraceae bacterium]